MTTYGSFLEAAVAGLEQGSGRLIADSERGPDWSDGWDAVVLEEGPGEATVYAIGAADAAGATLRHRIDRLAGGISAALAGYPVRLITIFTTTNHGGESIRALRRLSPPTFYQGLKPHTWVVNLDDGVVHADRFGGGDTRLIRAAARGEVAATEPAPDMYAFRSLMRGRQPIVTYALIAVNVAIFLLTYVYGGPDNGATLTSMGAIQPRLIEQGEWWRLITAIFLHAGVPHIMFNMLSLFAVGTLAERLYGSVKFLGIYLGAGLIGSAVSFFYAIATGDPGMVGVGASGAIFGVAGALVTARFHHSEVIPRRVTERVSAAMIPLVLISLGIAYITPYVDNAAHIGGLLGGMALSFVFPLTKSVPETARWWS